MMNQESKPVSVDYFREGADRPVVVDRFNTVAEAEAYIAELAANPSPLVRADVENGCYGINAPESMQ